MPSYTKNVLPMHPKPLPDESFTSWMLRASRLNGTKVFSLYYLMFPNQASSFGWNMDVSLTDDQANLIGSLFNLTSTSVHSMTLDSYAGLLFAEHLPYQRMQGLLIGSKKKRKLYHQQFCSLCLREQVQFFRKSWRIAFLTVCTSHGCYLRDRCPKCHSPVEPYRNDTTNSKLPFDEVWSRCYECGFDLSRSRIVPAPKEIVKETKLYEQVLADGYLELYSDTWIYSFTFFAVLKQIMRALIEKNWCSKKKLAIEALPLKSRIEAIKKSAGAFEEWPDRMLYFLESEQLLYSAISPMTKTAGKIPFWMDSLLKENRYQPNLNPSSEAVMNAINWMSNKGMRISNLSVNKALGLRDSNTVKRCMMGQ